jgi:hypothetical protein
MDYYAQGLSESRIDDTLPQDLRAGPSHVSTVIAVLRAHHIDFEAEALGDLRGCLVRSRVSATIHVNAELPLGFQAWAALHELGHHRLGHRPGSEWGFDDTSVSGEARAVYAEQEREANDFADLWCLVFDSICNYLWGTPIAARSSEAWFATHRSDAIYRRDRDSAVDFEPHLSTVSDDCAACVTVM